MRLYTTILVAGLVSLALVLLGFWWAPFAVGLVVGAVAPRPWVALPAGAGVGLLSWLIPLGVAHSRYGLGPTAGALAAIMGFDGKAPLPVVLTLVVATLLGLAGAWLGSAARGLTAAAAGDRLRRTDKVVR